MATAYVNFDQEASYKFDALTNEIERCFDDCYSILEARKNLLLEKVKRMKELYQKHLDIFKAMEQMEIARKATSDALTRNDLVEDKNQVMSIWDDKIKKLENEKSKLDEFCELKFVPNSVEFEQCVNTFHLNECGAMEFCKRREPCVMKKLGNEKLGGSVNGFGLAVDTDTDLLYVTDCIKKCICMFSKDGEFMKKFGEENLKSPCNLCLSKEYLFVTDGNSIVKFSKSGEFLTINNATKFNFLPIFSILPSVFIPSGICISSELVYVCNYNLGGVEVFNLDLVYSKCFGQKCLDHPVDIEINDINGGKIYVFREDMSVYVFDSDHNLLSSVTLSGIESHQILYFFRVDLLGNFVFSDRRAHCLKIYNAKGELIESIGNGYLTVPRGIAIDRNNRIIVVSESYNNLQLY